MSSSAGTGRTIFYVLLTLTLMIASSLVTYFIVKNNETTKREEIVASKDKEITDITTKMDSISKELDLKIKEAQKLGADYKTLETYKAQLESDISSLRNSADISSVQIKQYQDKIQAYEQMLSVKEKELQALKEENKQLTEAKDSLITKTDSLSSTVNEVTESNKILTAAASILHAENINVVAFNNRDKQESRSAFRAKRIDKLTIDFTVAENLIAQKGNKDIFLRLVEPSGTVIFNAAAGSGQFDLDGQASNFTLKKQIFYDNSDQKVQFVFNKPNDYDFKEGSYKIEIYSESKQIGYKVFGVQR